MDYSIFDSNVTVHGHLACKSVSVALDGGFKDEHLSLGADIDHYKLMHRHALVISQTGTIGAGLGAVETYYLRVMRATGSVLAIDAAITEAVATGADRTVTIDLQKSTNEGAFESILTSTINFDDGSTLRAMVEGEVADEDLERGDILRLVITTAGSAGDQAMGLLVQVEVRELPLEGDLSGESGSGDGITIAMVAARVSIHL